MLFAVKSEAFTVSACRFFLVATSVSPFAGDA
jgi:hypothetical protein